jgi:hypothetical protein
MVELTFFMAPSNRATTDDVVLITFAGHGSPDDSPATAALLRLVENIAAVGEEGKK